MMSTKYRYRCICIYLLTKEVDSTYRGPVIARCFGCWFGNQVNDWFGDWVIFEWMSVVDGILPFCLVWQFKFNASSEGIIVTGIVVGVVVVDVGIVIGIIAGFDILNSLAMNLDIWIDVLGCDTDLHYRFSTQSNSNLYTTSLKGIYDHNEIDSKIRCLINGLFR